MTKNDPSRLTATEAAAAIAAGTLTSQALTEACLARIADRDAAVQAWAHLDPQFALRQARGWRRSLGVGWPPRNAYPARLAWRALAGAPYVRAARGAQAIACDRLRLFPHG